MEDKRRDELLLKMYDQMFSDINRHIMVVWQSVGTLVGALAIFALTEKGLIPIDVASALILLICVWLLSHLSDASYWYNRNLAIISNIERQFLVKEDLHDIHYYFGKHRPDNKMITHLRIQYALGVAIALLVALHHALMRVYPGLSSDFAQFEVMRIIPYVVIVAGCVFLYRLHLQRNESYSEFLSNSPGIEVETSGVRYGRGHGFKDHSDQQKQSDSSKEN